MRDAYEDLFELLLSGLNPVGWLAPISVTVTTRPSPAVETITLVMIGGLLVVKSPRLSVVVTRNVVGKVVLWQIKSKERELIPDQKHSRGTCRTRRFGRCSGALG